MQAAGIVNDSYSTLSSVVRDIEVGFRERFRDDRLIAAEVLSFVERDRLYTLKFVEFDSDTNKRIAELDGIMWKTNSSSLVEFERVNGKRLQKGMKVLFSARPVYKSGFPIQLVVTSFDSAYTFGHLMANVESIRKSLRDEGIYNQNRELPRPKDIGRIAVISPPTSEGLLDYQNCFSDMPALAVENVYFPASMQGPSAAKEIVSAFQKIGKQAFDVVVIIRGGGDPAGLNDLNDIAIVRAVCECKIPVCTGIAHHRNKNMLDEVASAKYSTPSKVGQSIATAIVRRAEEFADLYRAITLNLRNRLDLEVQEYQSSIHKVQLMATSKAHDAQSYLKGCYDRSRSGSIQMLLSELASLSAANSEIRGSYRKRVDDERNEIDRIYNRIKSSRSERILEIEHNKQLERSRYFQGVTFAVIGVLLMIIILLFIF